MRNTIEFNFDNRFVRELPGDPDDSGQSRQVLGACYSRVRPTPVRAPSLLTWSPEVAQHLGLDAATVGAPEFAAVFGGNALVPGMEPYAACYGGHQFGNWAGQLGDGRAITLGEVLDRDGERRELQLKGAGQTPYSRHADGRAVLRSSIREFLCSEAMHHLGVPTTRALSIVTTGETVVRDMFYDGNPRAEPGAVVCRVAPSFIRFGNFEIFAARGDHALLERMVDFTIERDFPELANGSPANRRADWFRVVCERTARMIAHWMRVGFVHGVMNTDNMSILGLTIDYGPYGWVDNFDPNWTPNTTDEGMRRYRFGQQPRIANWNLVQLANALHPLFGEVEPLQAGLEAYVAAYDVESRAMTASKLGLDELDDAGVELVDDLYRLLARAEVDMTIFFRRLADVDPGAPTPEPLAEAFYSEQKRARHEDDLLDWLRRHAAMVVAQALPAGRRREVMHAANPLYVPRNYLAQQAIDAAEQGDVADLETLFDVLRRPYDEQPGQERFAGRRPDWARNRPGCSMLSCSS